MTNMKLSELVQVKQAVVPQDIVGGKTSAYYSMAGIGRVLAVLTTDTIAQTKKATIQLMQAKDAAGTGAKVLGSAVEKVVADAAGENVFLTAEAKASDLDLANGYTHVAVQVSSDNAMAVNGAAVLIFGDLSFRP
jgi:polyphosphate kinase 2 (PPK2 family)